MTRDNFSPATLRKIAGRAGYFCSYPGCDRLTVGPSDDRATSVTLTGEGSHITAAAPGGPRYDASLTSQVRASEKNGIWMCRTHGKWIDDNPTQVSVGLLQNWKAAHEKRIADLVANGRAAARNGITSLTLRQLGKFKNAPTVRLGRFNVVYGYNASGKSTFAQALAAFGGGLPLEHFIDRFGIRDTRGRAVQVTATAREGGTDVTVTLARAQTHPSATPTKPKPGRLHVEVNGAIAIDWPRQRFRAVMFDDLFRQHQPQTPAFEAALREIADAFQMAPEDILDGLRPELFVTAPLGYSFRNGAAGLKIHTDESSNYQPVETLSSGELQLAAAEIIMRLARARQEPSLLLILDSAFYLRLDDYGRQMLVDRLLEDDPALQLVICVNEVSQASALVSHAAATWIGAVQIDGLTIHSYD